MQSGVVLLCDLDRIQGRFITSFHVTNDGMVGRTGFITAVDIQQSIGADSRFVFAVGSDQHFALGKNSVQRIGAIHQHVSGAAAHEDLDATDIFFLFVGTQNLLGVVVGYAHVKGVIGRRTLLSDRIFVLQQRLRQCIGNGIGHFHEGGDTSGQGRA